MTVLLAPASLLIQVLRLVLLALNTGCEQLNHSVHSLSLDLDLYSYL